MGDKILGRLSPAVVAGVVQTSHRFLDHDILLQDFLIVHVTEMLSSPVFQLVRREGKSIDHALWSTFLRYPSILRFGEVCHRLSYRRTGSGHSKCCKQGWEGWVLHRNHTNLIVGLQEKTCRVTMYVTLFPFALYQKICRLNQSESHQWPQNLPLLALALPWKADWWDPPAAPFVLIHETWRTPGRGLYHPPGISGGFLRNPDHSWGLPGLSFGCSTSQMFSPGVSYSWGLETVSRTTHQDWYSGLDQDCIRKTAMSFCQPLYNLSTFCALSSFVLTWTKYSKGNKSNQKWDKYRIFS